MRLLLDTHVAIWALTQPELLSGEIQQLLEDSSNEVFVSAVSVLEIAIKFKLKKQNAPPFSGTEAIDYFERADYALLAVSAQHAAGVDHLPLLHSDPFDRLLVAQALSEPMRLVSRDPLIVAYSDTVITW